MINVIEIIIGLEVIGLGIGINYFVFLIMIF